jgi:hypothetical protein
MLTDALTLTPAQARLILASLVYVDTCLTVMSEAVDVCDGRYYQQRREARQALAELQAVFQGVNTPEQFVLDFREHHGE